MVSYKKLYLEKCKEYSELLNREEALDLACPQCGSQLFWATDELYCKGEGCKFDKTPSNWFGLLINHYDLVEFKS